MKRFIYLWIATFLTVILTLPLLPMAQTTPLKLVIETSIGDRIGGAQILGFSLAPDNTLIINVGSSAFDFQALLPDISIVAPNTNCNITGLASVSAAVGDRTITFSLFSSTPNTKFSLKVNPDKLDTASAGVSGGIFSWNIGGLTSGPYLAVVEATDGTNTSQLPVTITLGSTVTPLIVNNPTGTSGGTVTPASQTVSSGGTATFSVTTNSGFTASVSEGTLSSPSGTATWTIQNVTASKTPTITFAQQTCTATVTAQASGTGGAITSGLSQTVACGGTATFTGTLTSGATATVYEGNYSAPNGLNWTWGVTAPTTNGQTKNVTITFSTPTSCTATVIAQAQNSGGAISNSTWTGACGSTSVSFSGTLASGYTGATVSEGTFSPPTTSLFWTWSGITAPASGSKTVTITFTGSTPPPTGNCDKLGASCAAQVASATSLNFVACTGMDKDYFGYIDSQVSTCNSTTTRVAAGTTAWFLIDASKVTVPTGFSKPPYQMVLYIADYAQSVAQMQATLYPLDANNNLSTTDAYIAYGAPGPPYTIGLANNQGTSYMLYKSQRYLVKVDGNGCALSIWYGR